MKTALCLYGQPRDAHQKMNDIRERVIIPNECDVFFHAWYSDDDLSLKKMTPGHEGRRLVHGIDKHLLNEYQPKSWSFEKQRKFFHKNFTMTEDCIEIAYPWSKGYDRQEFVKDRAICTQSMWYSVMMSLLTKELYSQQNDFTYDCVILSRFDVAPTKIIHVADYDLTKLVTRNHPYPREEISDWFIFSNNDNMNAIGATFHSLGRHYERISENDNKVWVNEAFLREQAKLHGLQNSTGDFDVTF